jgi:UDPglucose--hexose-1-phosphate uridylyltransferase
MVAVGDEADWRVRIVNNRYPAVAGDTGQHDVVVLTPHHDRPLADLDPTAVAEALGAIQIRFRQLDADPDHRAALFFVNVGAGAGASLSHPHGQILATPVVPAVLRTEVAAQVARRRDRGTCLVCDLHARARQEGRQILATEEAAVFVPYASRFSFEMVVLPAAHAPRFTDAGPATLAAVASALVAACGALRAAADDPPYNLVLHSAPRGVQDFHWHLELLPRLTPLAGFETGTGFHINPFLPEAAAEALRHAVAATGEDPA